MSDIKFSSMRSTGKVQIQLEQQQLSSLLQMLSSNGSAGSIYLLATISGQCAAAMAAGSTKFQRNKRRRPVLELATCVQDNAKGRRLARRKEERAAAVRIQAAARGYCARLLSLKAWAVVFQIKADRAAAEAEAAMEAAAAAEAAHVAAKAAEDGEFARLLDAAEAVLASSRERRESNMLARAWHPQIYLNDYGTKSIKYVNSMTGEQSEKEPTALAGLHYIRNLDKRWQRFNEGSLSRNEILYLLRDEQRRPLFEQKILTPSLDGGLFGDIRSSSSDDE
mmetsp:Transcript_61098/g.101613  ORF Transcript_61098/g.101613 Transcript_61098/m.101613 type:complete len:280 (-) Transcript_61098:479-1318(-)